MSKEQAFNFDELEQIKRTVNRTYSASPMTRSRNKKGEVLFRFSSAAMEELGLDKNSLKTFATKDNSQVFLAVCTGNTGDWLRGRKGTTKGNQAKNVELSDAIDAAGLKGEHFSLTSVGERNGATYYKVEAEPEEEGAYEEPTGSGTEASSKKAKATA